MPSVIGAQFTQGDDAAGELDRVHTLMPPCRGGSGYWHAAIRSA